jgi:hypothetical protein
MDGTQRDERHTGCPVTPGEPTAFALGKEQGAGDCAASTFRTTEPDEARTEGRCPGDEPDGQEGLPVEPQAVVRRLEERVDQLEHTIRHLLALFEIAGSTVSSRARALREDRSAADRYESTTTST